MTSLNDDTSAPSDGEPAHLLPKPESDPGTITELIQTTVTKSGVAGSTLLLVNRMFDVMFAVFATHKFHTTKASLGIFFLISSIFVVCCGVFLTLLGDLHGFDYALEALFIPPTVGVSIVLGSNTFRLCALGGVLVGVAAGPTLVLESYIGKLSKIGALTTQSQQGIFSRQFVPQIVQYRSIVYAISPVLAGGLYEISSVALFSFFLGICALLCAFGICFLVGDYKEIVQRSGFRDVHDESKSDYDNYDRWMIFRVSLLTMSRFCSSLGAHGVSAFYVLFMERKYGVRPLYAVGQMTLRAVIGYFTALSIQRLNPNPFYVILFGNVVNLATALGMYYLTIGTHPDKSLIGWTWALFLFGGFTHVCSLLSTSIIVIETSSRGFVSRASLLLGGAALLTHGVGPFIYAISGWHLCLFWAFMRFFAIVFLVAFFVVEFFTRKDV